MKTLETGVNAVVLLCAGRSEVQGEGSTGRGTTAPVSEGKAVIGWHNNPVPTCETDDVHQEAPDL